MKKIAALLFLTICFSPLLFGQKTRFSQEPHTPKPPKPPVVYPLRIHISAIHARTLCSDVGCQGEIYADSVLDGKKIELGGRYLEFSTGDYHARLRGKEPVPNPTKLDVKYELLMPDGSVWRCSVSGFSE